MELNIITGTERFEISIVGTNDEMRVLLENIRYTFTHQKETSKDTTNEELIQKNKQLTTENNFLNTLVKLYHGSGSTYPDNTTSSSCAGSTQIKIKTTEPTQTSAGQSAGVYCSLCGHKMYYSEKSNLWRCPSCMD